MSSQGRIFQGRFHTLFVSALILFIAMVTASCGEGGGAAGTTSSTPSQATSALDKIILKADPGSVCETLLTGETYTRAPTELSCNKRGKGSDLLTAYLDGSKSTSSTGQALSYTWSFVSKPTGSNAALIGADTANPNFVPDKAGPYTVQLVVSDSGVSSPRAVALVMALDQATLNAPSTGTRSYFLHGGLTSNCSQCHNATSPTLESMPSAHLATSNLCQSCHSPAGFSVKSFVDHLEVSGSCSSCHDGNIAVGKSAGHLVTAQECSDCHTTDHFLKLNPDGTFDHAGITRVCSSCHNGTVAIGTDSDPSPSGHPSISVECNSCHTTTTFNPPFVNHSTVSPGTCGEGGCHDGQSLLNGVPITSKNSAPHPHPLTDNITTGSITKACDVCHNTTSFNLGGVFDHGILARHPIACKSCHDGLSAIGKTPTHLATDSDCGNCHHTSTFVGGFVDHTSADVTSKACTVCHYNSINPLAPAPAVGVPTAPAYSQVLVDIHTAAAGQSCGPACHTPGGSFALATIDHSGFGVVPSPYLRCSDCHDGGIATGKSTGHLTTTKDCGICHSPHGVNWLGATFDHSKEVSIINNASTPTCTSCHDGTAATGKSLTHVPLPTVGQDCLVCHGTSYLSFALPTFNHASADITSTTNCASCHDGKAHDGVKVISKPTGHIPTALDCSKCHADTANGPSINGTISSGFRTAVPFVNTLHPAYTTGCRTCHIVAYDNAIYSAKSHPIDSVHATVDANGWDCNACHTTTGNFKEVNPVNHQDPTIKAQACVTCHAAGNTTGAIGKGTTHPVTSDLCQQCHQAGGSFAGFDHATLTGGNKGLACATCHDGTTAIGKISNHVATSRDCAVCHAGYPPTAASFVGGTFSHTGPEMTGKLCATCHTGNIAGALGKTPTHPVTNSDCGGCHNTTTFTGATGGFNHTGVTTGCAASGCHASGTAGVVDVSDDPNRKHIPIVVSGAEVNCYACHKQAGGTFANATMDHSVVTSITCETCHDGITYDGSNTAHVVTGKTVGTPLVKGHFFTSVVACAACHNSTSAWTPVAVTFYKHLPNPPGYIPVTPAATGNHNTTKVPKCVTCHKDTKSGQNLINGNEDISTFPHATYLKTCAACHASKGENQHGKPLSPTYQKCGTSGCHKISSSSF